jgi:tungstate transport system substrate-binding protein
VKEMEIWQKAGLTPAGPWYVVWERGATGTDLLNYIAVIRVNPARFPRVNADGARRLADWLVSDEAQQLIKAFGVDRYGEPLFFPNADAWRKKPPTG